MTEKCQWLLSNKITVTTEYIGWSFLINVTHYDIFIMFSPISWHANGIFLAPYHVKACPHFCNKDYVANSAIFGNVYFIWNKAYVFGFCTSHIRNVTKST